MLRLNSDIATLLKTQLITQANRENLCKLCHVAEIFSYLEFLSAVCLFFLFRINHCLILQQKICSCFFFCFFW